MMGDPLGSSLVSSQKQNREGVVGAQSGQYRATVKSSLGCGECPGQDVTKGLRYGYMAEPNTFILDNSGFLLNNYLNGKLICNTLQGIRLIKYTAWDTA
ncbi:hypothetical protein ACFX2G_044274 [Malus domestica]